MTTRMTGWFRALLRLFAIQGTWNYERMQGVGMGYAAEPLLEDLKSVDPTRHAEAVVRSAEFFNANPNLAGLALGATARAEYEAVPGVQIARLRTALCSPLGAMGDQLFWAGLVPALVGAALVGVALRTGWWPIAGLLLVYNIVRLWVGVGSLNTGTRAGMGVGTAISASWIPRAIELVGPVAGFAVGVATPIVAHWYLRGIGFRAAFGVAAITAAGLAGMRYLGPAFTTVRFALGAIGLTVILRWLIQ
jgi:mannose PTS system EIID component